MDGVVPRAGFERALNGDDTKASPFLFNFDINNQVFSANISVKSPTSPLTTRPQNEAWALLQPLFLRFFLSSLVKTASTAHKTSIQLYFMKFQNYPKSQIFFTSFNFDHM